MKTIIILFCFLHSFNLTAQEEPRLKTLMATMGGHAQGMLYGILYENYDMIENAVAWVNNHAQPTADMGKIKEELGVEAIRFKYYDTVTHNAANAMGKAARKKDLREVSRQYATMIQSCTKCHDTFRERLRVVLHRDDNL